MAPTLRYQDKAVTNLMHVKIHEGFVYLVNSITCFSASGVVEFQTKQRCGGTFNSSSAV